MNTTDSRGPRRRLLALSVAALALLTLVTSPASAQSLNPRLVAKADGPSGLKWIGGDRESDLMHPGLSCIACHTQSGEGPRFQVAGTVYTNIDEQDDYFGVEGATVQATDAKGKVATFTTNKAGNFSSGRFSAALALPLTIKVLNKA